MPDKIHIPEVIEPDEKLPKDLVALRRFARFMDEAFEVPGTRMRVGFDALIGLIPGIGDVVGALLSTWIIVGGLRHRVGPMVILRMIGNIVIDLLFGSVPVAGDVFDFLYEENVRNMRLLEKHRDRRRPPRSYAGVALMAAVVILVVFVLSTGIVAGFITGIIWLFGKLSWS